MPWTEVFWLGGVLPRFLRLRVHVTDIMGLFDIRTFFVLIFLVGFIRYVMLGVLYAKSC